MAGLEFELVIPGLQSGYKSDGTPTVLLGQASINQADKVGIWW